MRRSLSLSARKGNSNYDGRSLVPNVGAAAAGSGSTPPPGDSLHQEHSPVVLGPTSIQPHPSFARKDLSPNRKSDGGATNPWQSKQQVPGSAAWNQGRCLPTERATARGEEAQFAAAPASASGRLQTSGQTPSGCSSMQKACPGASPFKSPIPRASGPVTGAFAAGAQLGPSISMQQQVRDDQQQQQSRAAQTPPIWRQQPKTTPASDLQQHKQLPHLFAEQELALSEQQGSFRAIPAQQQQQQVETRLLHAAQHMSSALGGRQHHPDQQQQQQQAAQHKQQQEQQKPYPKQPQQQHGQQPWAQWQQEQQLQGQGLTTPRFNLPSTSSPHRASTLFLAKDEDAMDPCTANDETAGPASPHPPSSDPEYALALPGSSQEVEDNAAGAAAGSQDPVPDGDLADASFWEHVGVAPPLPAAAAAREGPTWAERLAARRAARGNTSSSRQRKRPRLTAVFDEDPEIALLTSSQQELRQLEAQINELDNETPAAVAAEGPASTFIGDRLEVQIALQPLGPRSLPAAAAAEPFHSSMSCKSTGFPARKLVSRKSSLCTACSNPRGELLTALSPRLAAAAAGDGTPGSYLSGRAAKQIGSRAGAAAATAGESGRKAYQGEQEGRGADWQEQQQREQQQDFHGGLYGAGVQSEDDVLLSDGQDGDAGFVLDRVEASKWFKGMQAGLRDITNLPGETPAAAGSKGQGRGLGQQGEEQQRGDEEELWEQEQQQCEVRQQRRRQQQQSQEEEEEDWAATMGQGDQAGDGGNGLWDDDVCVEDVQQLDEAEWGDEAGQQLQRGGNVHTVPAARVGREQQQQQKSQQKQQKSWQSNLDAVLQTAFVKKPPAVPGPGGSRLQHNSNSYAQKMLKEHKEQEQRLKQMEQAALVQAAVPRAVLPQQLRQLQTKPNRQQQQKRLGRTSMLGLCEEDVISDSQGDSDIMEITPLPGPAGVAAAAAAGRSGSASHYQQHQQLSQRRVSGQPAASGLRPGLTPESSTGGHHGQLGLRTSLLQTPGPAAALNFSRVDQQQQHPVRQSNLSGARGSTGGYDSHCGQQMDDAGISVSLGETPHAAAAADLDHKPPWWDVLPDFVPVEVLAERGLDPRDGQPVYISYKSQFKESTVPTPARNQHNRQAGSRAPKGSGSGGAAGGGGGAGGFSRSSKGKGSKQRGRKGSGSGGRSSKGRSASQQGAGVREGGGDGGGQVGTWTFQGRNKVYTDANGKRHVGQSGWMKYQRDKGKM